MRADSCLRREVRFGRLTDVLADLDWLERNECVSVGNWSIGQILNHLGLAVVGYFDGFGFRASWLSRTVIAPLLKNYVLTRPMRPGFRLRSSAGRLAHPEDLALPVAFASLRSAIARLECELPSHPHPFFGRLCREEVVALTLRHCELHLSFIVPKERA